MTWTYSGNPGSSARNLVRFLIGDTLTTRQLLSDEEIDAVLTYQSSPSYAAAACADAIANLFSSKVDKSIGQTSLSLSQAIRQYREMADRLRAGGPGNLPGGDGSGERDGGIFVGGAEIAADDALRDDSTVNQPSFSVGQDDDPSTDEQNRSNWNRW
jgi:hypothetical protein